MSNVVKLGKKFFTVGVAITTMLWSVVGSTFFALLPASAAVCPTLNSGNLLKVVGKPAIYSVNNAGKVLYFPSGDEFKSWNADEKYGGYVSVTQACFDSLAVPSTYPGAINYRAGSWIVKRPSSDQLYVVEPGNTLAKITPEFAKALYGSSYKVMTVADAFWPHYVNRGADVTEAKVHPGMLASNGGKTWYVDMGTDNVIKLREVTASGMTANRLKAAFVRAVPDSAVAGFTHGDVISAEVPALTDRSGSGGVVGGPVTTSGALTVSLAADNPFAATIVSDNASTSNGAQAMIPVLKLNFAAASDGDVKVTSFRLKRGGISADTDISNMYLFDGDTKLAANPSVANNMVTFTNSAGLFTVNKGTSKSVTVKMDLKNSVSAGKTYTFSVAAASDVVTGGTVGGSFPVMGNTFTSASVTDLGKLTLTNVSPTAAGTVDPGTTGYEIWRFTAASVNQDIELRKMVFTLVGSINPGDVQNFSLWDGATQIGSSVAQMSADKTVTFDWSVAPYVITKGLTRTLSLKADIVGGTNRTFYASIQNSGDVITYDKNYGVFLKTNGTDSFTVVQAGGSSSVNWTINVGTLTQTLSSDSPTGNVASSSVNTVLGRFMWKANGEDIKVSSLNVSTTIAGGASTVNLKNVRLVVNGSQVGSSITTLAGNGASNNGWGTFGNSFVIKVGTTAKVEIVADLSDTTIGANDTIVVGFPAGSTNAQGVVSLSNISTVAQTSNTLTVKGGTVSITKNAAFGDKSSSNPTGPVNAQQVKVASFVITAGAGEDVDVSQITLRDDNTGTCIGTYLQNLTLKDAAGKQLGATYANPSTTCTTQNTYTFNISPAARVVNGSQYVVDVYADLKAALASATSLMDLNAVTANGRVTGADASANSQNLSLQQMVISSAGNLMVQLDPDAPVANNYLMGATDQTIAKYKITASSTEAINITQLVVSANLSSAATGTMQNIRLVDDATGQQVGSAVSAFSNTVAGSSAATTTYAHATFSNLTLQVGKGVSKTLSLKVDFTTYENTGLATTGQTVNPVVLQMYAGNSGNNPVTATGASSGSSVTATISTTGSNTGTGNSVNPGAYAPTTTLYRAKLTTAWASDTPSGASSPSSAQVVAKFVVTNLANAGSYTATVNSINLQFSTTISNAAGSAAPTLTMYKDSLSSSAIATTYFSNTGASSGDPVAISGHTAITTTNFNNGNGVDIASGSSKTFYVTLDTSGAASTKSLSVRIPAGATGLTSARQGITWTDGISATLGVMGTDLPLIFKTFTY